MIIWLRPISQVARQKVSFKTGSSGISSEKIQTMIFNLFRVKTNNLFLAKLSNKESAKNSRIRKKLYIELLEAKISLLSKKVIITTI